MLHRTDKNTVKVAANIRDTAVNGVPKMPPSVMRLVAKLAHFDVDFREISQIIERDPRLVEELNLYYGDTMPDGGLDKLEGELLLDLVARHFTGRLWPRTGGMDATRRFMADLQRAMTKAGWKVDLFAVAA